MCDDNIAALEVGEIYVDIIRDQERPKSQTPLA